VPAAAHSWRPAVVGPHPTRKGRQVNQPPPDAVAVSDTPRLFALAQRHRNTDKRMRSLQILKAVRLAPTLEICEALLRGETVPKGMLDPAWRKAYGI
jgi:hypothetical protein